MRVRRWICDSDLPGPVWPDPLALLSRVLAEKCRGQIHIYRRARRRRVFFIISFLFFFIFLFLFFFERESYLPSWLLLARGRTDKIVNGCRVALKE